MSRASETAEIVLGGRVFPVQAFTFDQLQRMMPAFGRLGLGLAEGGLAAARDIIAAALSDTVPAEDLAELRTTVAEILSAVQVVARVSGLAQLGESLAGTANR